jgi:mannose-6-phosphate isomerase-like protein (cupin superfamily)
MRVFDSASAQRSTVGVIHVARWEQYDLADALPFGSMWYWVPPGDSSPRDEHPEAELSLVVAGTAVVEVAGERRTVDAGSAFLLDGSEPHTVHNDGDEPLLIFSAYWLPAAELALAGVRSA